MPKSSSKTPFKVGQKVKDEEGDIGRIKSRRRFKMNGEWHTEIEVRYFHGKMWGQATYCISHPKCEFYAKLEIIP